METINLPKFWTPMEIYKNLDYYIEHYKDQKVRQYDLYN